MALKKAKGGKDAAHVRLSKKPRIMGPLHNPAQDKGSDKENKARTFALPLLQGASGQEKGSQVGKNTLPESFLVRKGRDAGKGKVHIRAEDSDVLPGLFVLLFS